MKINRRDFLKTTALTSIYFAGFGVPTFANTGLKKNLVVVMIVMTNTFRSNICNSNIITTSGSNMTP